MRCCTPRQRLTTLILYKVQLHSDGDGCNRPCSNAAPNPISAAQRAMGQPHTRAVQNILFFLALFHAGSLGARVTRWWCDGALASSQGPLPWRPEYIGARNMTPAGWHARSLRLVFYIHHQTSTSLTSLISFYPRKKNTSSLLHILSQSYKELPTRSA